jgi:hypothetical protein
MSEGTFEHAVREWLDAGSDRTPADAIDAVLLAVKTTPQERDLRIPRRFTLMASSMRLAAGVALAAIVGVAALALLNQTSSVGRAPTPTPQPSATAGAVASPAPSPTTEPTAPPSTFTSSRYGYSIDLPAGWTGYPAFVSWDGTSAPAYDQAAVDQLKSSTGTVAWVMSAPTTKTLPPYIAAQTAIDAVEHPCPTAAELDQAITIDGEPARMLVKHCGTLVVSAAVIHKGSGYFFYFQHLPEDTADPESYEIFKTLLAGVTWP